MPNNIVFNDVATQLKTQIYGNNGGSAVPFSVDGSGNLIVTATDLDIRSLSPTTDTVTVTATDFDIRDLSGATDSITKAGNFFTESNTTLTASTTGVALTIDTSQQDLYSFYVANTGAATISVKLQIAPTNSSTYYIDDPSSEVSIASGESAVLVAQKFLKYTRLYFNPSDTTTIEAYYNAHV